MLHLNDLTYSVVAGPDEGIPRSLHGAYGLLCEGLLAGFRLLGFEAESGCGKTRSSRADICFMRIAIGDIVFQGRKFLGNAQTWVGSSMLQHGSIIVAPQGRAWTAILKPNMPEEALRDKIDAATTSLEEILCRSIKLDEIKAALTEGFGKVLQAKFSVGELKPDELRLAREIASTQKPLEDSDSGTKLLSANLA